MIFQQKMTYDFFNYTYNGLIIPMEIWRPITDEMVPGVKPVYWVSNIGNLYNAERDLFFNIDISKCKRYVPVTLTLKNKKQVHIHLHRLVCMAFHGMPVYPYNEVDHRNFDKTCNFEGNLEWVSQEENYIRALNAGRMKKNNGRFNDYPKGVESSDSKWEGPYTEGHDIVWSA